jgi:hypothetical protein
MASFDDSGTFGDNSVEQLPYDDVEIPDVALEAEPSNSLSSRIAKPRIYLLSESSAALHGRIGKVRNQPRITTCFLDPSSNRAVSFCCAGP